MKSYFLKVTRSGKAIVLTSAPLGSEKKTINGKEVMVRKQVSGLRIGFAAIENASELNLKPGQEVPLAITDVPVLSRDGQPLRNLFWAE
jgi:hypothetical protein